MANEYCTVRKEGKGRYEEKKSMFLAEAARVTTPDEASDMIRKIKKTYPDARHHVYAYLLRGGNIARYSDDGEPQGTGGLPVLELIRRSGAEDLCIVVTRYFGGVLLGTGGLTRAYGTAAKEALADAGVTRYLEYTELTLCCSYAEYQVYRALLPLFGALVDRTDYGEEVTLALAVRSADLPAFVGKITEVSGGKTIPTVRGTRFDRGDAVGGAS